MPAIGNSVELTLISSYYGVLHQVWLRLSESDHHYRDLIPIRRLATSVKEHLLAWQSLCAFKRAFRS